MTNEIAEKLVCADSRWGRKSTLNGPISGDTIAYRLGELTPDGRNTPMKVWDFCASCGDPSARISLFAAEYERITDQRFIPVSNHRCEGGGENPPPPPPPPPGGEDMRVMLLKITLLLESIERGQTEQTNALRQAIAELRNEVKAGVKIRW